MRIFVPLGRQAAQRPLAQRTSGKPHVFILVPILILGRSQFGSQKMRASLRILIDGDAVFQEAPAPINCLRSGFDSNLFVGARELVLYHLDVSWMEPFPNTPYLHAFMQHL